MPASEHPCPPHCWHQEYGFSTGQEREVSTGLRQCCRCGKRQRWRSIIGPFPGHGPYVVGPTHEWQDESA